MSAIINLSESERVGRQIEEFRSTIWKMDSASTIARVEMLGYDMDRLSQVVAPLRPDGSMRRMDAGESAMLARALIFMKAQSVDVQYAPTEFRELFSPNLNTSVPLGADQVSTPQFDRMGSFKRIANGSNDMPNIDVSQTETLNKFYTFAAKISYSVQDLARAAFSGIPLDTKKQQAARLMWEQQLDELAAVGDSEVGIYGLANSANAQLITTNNGGTWATKAAAGNQLQIVDDVNKLCKAIITTSKNNVKPDTIAMGIDHHALISTTPWNTANPSNVTVLDFILKTNPWIKRIIPWSRMDLADAGGTGPRVTAFSTRTDVCEFMINDLAMLAPEIRGFGTDIGMYGRCAGLVASQPKGVAHMDAV